MAKQIKWSTGFFRLWVLVSSIWVLIVGAIAWPGVHEPFVGRHVFIEFEGDVAWDYFSVKAIEARGLVNRRFYIEAEVVGAPGITYIGRGGETLAETMKQKAPLMIGFYKARLSASRANALWTAAGFGLVPPLVLLITGALVAWVLRGFSDERAEGGARNLSG